MTHIANSVLDENITETVAGGVPLSKAVKAVVVTDVDVNPPH